MSDHSSSDDDSSGSDRDDLVKDLVDDLSEYMESHYNNVTIEGLQETMEKYPVEIPSFTRLSWCRCNGM